MISSDKIEGNVNKPAHKRFRIEFIFYLVALISILIFIAVLVVGLILLGISPCSIYKCHENATCTNYPFYAECSCMHGFVGDGIHHCDECGISYYPQNATLIGTVANPYSWPAYGVMEFDYAIFGEIQDEKLILSNSDYCAVTIINRRFLLTAARCLKTEFTIFDWFYQTNYTFPVIPSAFYSSIEAMYNIYLGTEYFVYYGVDLPHVYLGYIESVIVHPDFDPLTFQNDIALIKLKYEVNFDKEMQPACLPEESFGHHRDPNHIAYSVGFGSVSRMFFRRFSLSNAVINIMNHSFCRNVDINRPKDWSKQICAGEFDEFNNKTNYCMGDIGSALYMPHLVNDKFKFVVVGVLSYHEGCATQHAPAVYTSVVAYKDWIKQNSKY